MAATRYVVVVNTSTPVGTTAASPVLTNVNLGDVVVNSFNMRIPPGHAGTTGLQLRLANNVLLPWGQQNGWLIGDNEDVTFDINEEITTGLVIATYNLGAFVHSHLLRIDYTPISLANYQPPTVSVVSIT